MKKPNIDGVIIENWRENERELARLNGLPDTSILFSRSRLGKTRMETIAKNLAAARKYSTSKPSTANDKRNA